MTGGLEGVNTATGAFLLGLATSVHCVGMCGPLACGVAGFSKGKINHGAAAGYHFGRVASYTVLGLLAGAIGDLALGWLKIGAVHATVVILPWALVAALLLFGLGLDKHLPRVPLFAKLGLRLRGWFTKVGPGRGGLALGLATPLLPCGPLYLVFGLALITGSALRGAEFLAAFALGTIPLLWVTQGGWLWLRGRFGARGLDIARRSLLILTAVVLAWRLRGSLPFIEVSGVGCGCGCGS